MRERNTPFLTCYIDRGEIAGGTALAGGESQVDEYRLLFFGQMQDANVLPTQSDGQGAGHLIHGDAGEGGLFPINGKDQLLLIVLAVQSTSTTPTVFLPGSSLTLRRNTGTAGIIRTVNLGHQGRQYRRTGRDLGHLDPSTVSVGNGLDQRSDTLGDVM